jgi:hypothetical protein
MVSIFYLLSSSQGLTISRCCLNSSQDQPNWINIARLVAFVANIFRNENEFHFNDGNLTFFTYQQPLEDGSHYFVTFFTDNDTVNLSSLSRYVAITSTILFQPLLGAISKQLEERTLKQIQSNTYHDTIQNGEINDDCDYSDPQHELYDDFHNLMGILTAFEEHLIRRLLVSETNISVSLFHLIESYFHKVFPSKGNVDKKNFEFPPKKISVLSLSDQGILFRILSNCDNNLSGSNIIVNEDLKSAVIKASDIFGLSNQQELDAINDRTDIFGLFNQQELDRTSALKIDLLRKQTSLLYIPNSARAAGSKELSDKVEDIFVISRLSHVSNDMDCIYIYIYICRYRYAYK